MSPTRSTSPCRLGLDDAPSERRPRLLSDNGPSYVASDLSEWLEDQGMKHTRGKPYHPMTQGKIERWHLSLKSRILLENYYLPGDLERAVADFVEHYNHRRYHESLDNLTPADVYFGRGHAHPATSRGDQTQDHRATTPTSICKPQHENHIDGPDALLAQKLNCPEKPDDGQLEGPLRCGGVIAQAFGALLSRQNQVRDAALNVSAEPTPGATHAVVHRGDDAAPTPAPMPLRLHDSDYLASALLTWLSEYEGEPLRYPEVFAEYCEMCLAYDFVVRPWNPVARAFTLLTTGRKDLSLVSFRRRNPAPPPRLSNRDRAKS